MVQFKARAAFIASSTAALLMTGKVPGMPQQTSQTDELGGAVVVSTTAHEQNILERVASSTCTSKPMSALYLILTTDKHR
jgi:hypothetical protein